MNFCLPLQQAVMSLQIALKDRQSTWSQITWTDPLQKIHIATTEAFDCRASIIICDAFVDYFGDSSLLNDKYLDLPLHLASLLQQESDRHILNPWLFIASCSVGNLTFVRDAFQYARQCCDDEDHNGKNHWEEFFFKCLHVAVKQRQTSVIQFLLENGSDVNQAVPQPCESVLVAAAWRSQITVLRILCEPRFKLHKQGVMYEEGIRCAAEHEDPVERLEMVKYLCMHASNLNQPSIRSEVFWIACDLDDIALAQWCLDKGPVDIFGPTCPYYPKRPPLSKAVQRGCLPIVQLIVRHRGSFVPCSELDKERAYYNAFRKLASRNSSLTTLALLKAIIPIVEHWSPQQKIIKAACVEGGIEIIADMFGPFDFAGSSGPYHRQPEVSLGSYLCQRAAQLIKPRNLKYMLQQGVRSGIEIFVSEYQYNSKRNEYEQIEELLKSYGNEGIEVGKSGARSRPGQI